jgi:hypothetical protein
MKVKLKSKNQIAFRDELHNGKIEKYFVHHADIRCTEEMFKCLGSEVEINFKESPSPNYDHFWGITNREEMYSWPISAVESISDMNEFPKLLAQNKLWKVFQWKQEIQEIANES